VFGNEVPHGFVQHVLLRLPQIDAQLLEGDDSLVARVVVAADVKLVPSLGFTLAGRMMGSGGACAASATGSCSSAVERMERLAIACDLPLVSR
jgi:hypothetical protein